MKLKMLIPCRSSSLTHIKRTVVIIIVIDKNEQHGDGKK